MERAAFPFFIGLLFEKPRFFVMWVIVVMFSICCHEFAHAWVADRQGDPTPRSLGHFSLNPLKQMGPMSIVLLLIIGVAWGSVPVVPRNFKNKWSQLYVSAAGPVTNLILAAAFTLLYAGMHYAGGALAREPQVVFQHVFFLGVMINVLLAILNLLPVPPLDGWNVWGYVIPKLNNLDDGTKRVVFFLGTAVIIFSIGILWRIAENTTIRVITLTGAPIIRP